MTEENPLTIAELGAYTNNSMNREGIKHLVDTVNGLGEPPSYTAGKGITISEDDVISLDDTWTQITFENTRNPSSEIRTELTTNSGDYEYIIGQRGYYYLITGLKGSKFISSWSDYNKAVNLIPLTMSSENNMPLRIRMDSNGIKAVDTSIANSSSGFYPTSYKYIDFDGTTIDTTNISNYITRSGEEGSYTYTLIKPFIAYYKTSGTYPTYISVVVLDEISPVSCYVNYNIVGGTLNISGIYEFLFDTTNLRTFSTKMLSTTEPYIIQFNNVSTSQPIKMYKRKKSIELPTES